jgi:hypothetical protein
VALNISWKPEACVATLTGVFIINVGVTAFTAGAVVGATETGAIVEGLSQPVIPSMTTIGKMNEKKFLIKVVTLFPFP